MVETEMVIDRRHERLHAHFLYTRSQIVGELLHLLFSCQICFPLLHALVQLLVCLVIAFHDLAHAFGLVLQPPIGQVRGVLQFSKVLVELERLDQVLCTVSLLQGLDGVA